MSDTQKTEAEVVAQLARENTMKTEIINATVGNETIPLAVLPGNRSEFKDLRTFLPQPQRRKGTTTLFDPPSFIAYVDRFATPQAVITADVQETKFTAYLEFHDGNDQTPPAARHADFRATYTLRETEDWERWTGSDKKVMNQIAFAQFLEDNLHNVAVPDGQTLLAITNDLQVHTNVVFKSAQRLSDGTTQLRYEENTEGATKGDLKLPTEITLGLIPFEGAAQFAVEARLRYRVESGSAKFWYELVRPDKVVEAAFRDVEKVLQEGLKARNLLWIQGQVGA